MMNTPPELHRANDILLRRPLPRSPPEPILSSPATNAPHFNTSGPKQTFNPDGTRRYLNVRPAGGQPFPLQKGKRYLAEDYKDGIEVKKGKGATSSAEMRRAESKRAAGSASAMQDEDRVGEQGVGAISSELSSLDSDSSPERPLIEVLRAVRKDGGRFGGSGSGEVGTSGDASEESEADRGRKMGRDVGKRGGGTRGGKR